MKQLGMMLSKQSKRPAAHAPVGTPSPMTTSIARGVSSSMAIDGDGRWLTAATSSPGVVTCVNWARVDCGSMFCMVGGWLVVAMKAQRLADKWASGQVGKWAPLHSIQRLRHIG
ncbi:unnamed protein product [Phytophthora fragariaefolia]|uniref:Unnamed protein product n=1 Tax=Phytophthora fragariaefolia TaxID=1490495 RepID=A0A9W6WTC5_9STRA|nr:unnamed protein product [Phytophthora fragariaefolia]